MSRFILSIGIFIGFLLSCILPAKKDNIKAGQIDSSEFNKDILGIKEAEISDTLLTVKADEILWFFYYKSLYYTADFDMISSNGQPKCSINNDYGVVGPFFYLKDFVIYSPGYPEGSEYWFLVPSNCENEVLLKDYYFSDVIPSMNYGIFSNIDDKNKTFFGILDFSTLDTLILFSPDQRCYPSEKFLSVVSKKESSIIIDKYSLKDLKPISSRETIQTSFFPVFVNEDCLVFQVRNSLLAFDHDLVKLNEINISDYAHYQIIEEDKKVYAIKWIRDGDIEYVIKALII